MEIIKYEIKDMIARITMDDSKANAMNPELFDELESAIDRSEKDDARALVIAGRTGFQPLVFKENFGIIH